MLQLKASDERYTPAHIIAPLVKALGPIAYDPCTPTDNPAGARAFSSLPEDGLTQDWEARAQGGWIWVNPPFSRMLPWSRVATKWAGLGCELVVLTGVDPSTEWYSFMFSQADLLAQLKQRVAFITPATVAGFKSGAKGPTALWYFGMRAKAFHAAFEDKAHFVVPGMVP